MQKITPFLWFDDRLEEAIHFYLSVFKDGRIVSIRRNGDKAFGATFELFGQTYMAINGGPHFKFNEAVSLFVRCETQAEVDYYWRELTAGGGAESQCGWLKDKFGLSWQIIPNRLEELLGDPDPARAQRAMQAMLQMRKLDIAKLEAAAAG